MTEDNAAPRRGNARQTPVFEYSREHASSRSLSGPRSDGAVNGSQDVYKVKR